MITPKRNIRKGITPAAKTSSNPMHLLDKCILEVSPTRKYRFPVIDEVPPDHYIARLDFVEPSVTAKGRKAVDTCQTFMNRAGDLLHVRQRYVIDSLHYRQLVDALCDAGAPRGKSITAAVGVIERLRFGYPTDSEIGSIIKRIPYDYKEGETQESLAEYFVDYPEDEPEGESDC